MHVDATIGTTVKNTAPVVLITPKSCERRPLDVVKHAVDFSGRWRIFRCPGHNTARVSMLGSQRVDELGCESRIASEHSHLSAFFTQVIVGADQIVDGLIAVAGAVV
jgi:hypothetical protein